MRLIVGMTGATGAVLGIRLLEHLAQTIRAGYADGLVGRAADVVLKERRELVLVPRETPLSEIHLENMLELARKGVQIVPPMPAFYNHPKSVDELIDHLVVRILDQFDLPALGAKRWGGMRHAREIHTVA